MVRAWRVSLGGNRDPHSRRQSSLTFSRLRANRGLTRWQKICSRCGVDRPSLTKSQIWTLVTPEAQTKCRFRVPHIIVAPSPKYHLLCSARWPFGLGRSGKVHTAENGLFNEPQLWSSRPPLITQPQQVSQWAPQGLKGMNYLPASLGPLQSGNGAGLGAVTSTNWALERSSQRTKARRNGEFVVGKIRSTGYKRACHSTSIGPQAQGHSLSWICLDLCRIRLYPSKSGHRQFLPSPAPQSPALDRSSQLLPSFVKQAPWAEYLRKKPSPSPERSAEVVAPTFMQKIPGHQKFE